MFSSSLAPFLFFLVPTTFAVCVVILVSAIFQDNKQFGWAVSMKYAFLAVVSFLSVLVLSASIVILGYLSLQRWVFTDSLYEALGYSYSSVQPPELFYFDPQVGADAQVKCVQDATECPLTDAHKEQIRVWKEQYEDWKTMRSAYFQNAKNFVSALSLFIVTLPLFVVSFFFFRKLQGRLNSKSVIKHIYYYGLSFIALAVVVGAGGILLNIGLKGILLLDEDTKRPGGVFSPWPVKDARSEAMNIEQLPNCVSVCGLPEEYGVLAREWQEDLAKAKEREKIFNMNHDEYAAMIPLILVGSILFAYHFLLIRRNGRSETLDRDAQKLEI